MGGLGPHPGLLQPSGLGLGGAHRRGQQAQLLGQRGHPGVGGVQRPERLLDLEPRLLDVGPGRQHLEAQPLLPALRLVVGRGGLVDRGLDLEQRRGRGRAPDGPVGAEQIALGGDGTHARQRGDERGGLVESRDDGDLAQRPGQRRPQGLGRGHEVQRPPHAVRQRRPGPVGVLGGAADQQSGAAGVLLLEPGQSRRRVDGGRDGHGIGHRPQRRGQCRLRAGLDVHERGHRPEHPGGRRVQHRSGPVAYERQRQRVAPGRPGAAVALGHALLGLQGAQGLGGGGQVGRGLLVTLVEVDLTLVESARLDLQRLEVGLRAGGPGPGLLEGGGQPAELGLGSRGP